MNDQIQLRFYTAFFHPVLAIFVPFWFLVTVLLVFTNSLLLPAGIVVFPPMYFVLLILVGMSETITGNLLYKERIAGILPRLREFVFVAAVGFFLILLFHGEVARKDFNIGRIKIWLPALFLGIQWFLSYFVHQKLREREIFLKYFAGKDGKQVKEIYQSFMHEGSESLKAIKSVKKLIIALIVLAFVGFVLTSWILRIQYKGFALLIILSLFGLFTLIIATLNTWYEAQFIMMDGHIVPRRQRRFRFGLTILLFIIVFVLIIPVTGSDALLPESYLAAFFKWLESIGRFEPPDRETEAPEFQFQAPQYESSESVAMELGEGGRQVDFSAITRIIGWVLLTVLVIGAAIFLLYPLFRGVRGGFSFRAGYRKISDNIKKGLNAFYASVVNALQMLNERRKTRAWKKTRTGTLASTAQMAARKSAERRALRRRDRRIQGRILRAFFKFTRWGEKHGVAFSLTTGPWEYAQKVAAETPEIGDDCVDIALMFEEMLYSSHPIEDQLRSALLGKIRDVTKTR